MREWWIPPEDDVSQETECLFLEHPDWPQSPGFRFAVKRNVARNLSRKYRRMVPGGLGGGPAGPGQPDSANLLYLGLEQRTLSSEDPGVLVERQELRAEILRQMDNLSGIHRLIMTLRYHHDMKPQHIAEHINMPVEKIYEAIRTSKSQLRRLVQGQLTAS